MRILLVEGCVEIADELRQNLGRHDDASFEVVCEESLVDAAAQIQGDSFDLLLIDPQLPDLERDAALELATDLAHRLPVVVLTGTEALDQKGGELRSRLSACVEKAEVGRKMLSAIRRYRRLGTGVMTPIFCRLEGLCG